MNRQVEIPEPPQRIVSLVPSQTELLFYLGVGDRVVGLTKFCIHPEGQVRSKTKVGGTKDFKPEAISLLQPDLIIGNKEENHQAGIESLQERYPVWMSDITSLEDAFEMISCLGELTGTSEKANTLVHQLRQQFKALPEVSPPIPAAYFIWRKPYMVAGGGTFIDHLLCLGGFSNVFGHLPRYPEATVLDLQKAQPQVILLSSEPYPFKEKHLSEFKAICPEAKVIIVDGELFSWYGSRLLQSGPYLQHLIQHVTAP